MKKKIETEKRDYRRKVETANQEVKNQYNLLQTTILVNHSSTIDVLDIEGNIFHNFFVQQVLKKIRKECDNVLFVLLSIYYSSSNF